MSKKSRDAAARAEARRRARLSAQGRLDETEDATEAEAPVAARSRPSLLKSIFPPAAPLPGKGDPLAGFNYSGQLRPVVASLWLIVRNPIAGLGMGLIWAVAWAVTSAYSRSTAGTVASFVSFGALVAAGIIGWQRPWLYGLTAAVFGYVIYAAYVVIGLSGQLNDNSASATLAQFLLINGTLQAFIGGLAGFYGGYLRRRFADPNLRAQQQARKKR
jgi:hypothetical protein